MLLLDVFSFVFKLILIVAIELVFEVILAVLLEILEFNDCSAARAVLASELIALALLFTLVSIEVILLVFAVILVLNVCSAARAAFASLIIAFAFAVMLVVFAEILFVKLEMFEVLDVIKPGKLAIVAELTPAIDCIVALKLPVPDPVTSPVKVMV